MSASGRDLAQELLDECGFWRNFTGEVRRPARSVLARSRWIVRVLARALILSVWFRPERHRRRPPQACDVLVIYVTENQRQSFQSWLDGSINVQTASWMPDADWEMSWRRCGILSLCHFWSVYTWLRSRSDYDEMVPWIEEFVRYRAGLVLAADLYRRARPPIVAVSNDHGGLLRAFIREARRAGCKVVYTQHASIGRHFPPLDFDLSLLDGIQAYLHYRESGVPRGSIVITGRNRADLSKPGADTATRGVIGLATNWDDSLLEWIPVLRRVRERFPNVVLRCHPAETRKLAWRGLCRLFGIRIDSGTLQDFLSRTTVLISGMSGIVLDAALRGVPSLVYLSSLRKSEKMMDYFGYQGFGLCKQVTRVDDLPQMIHETVGERVDPERVGVYEAGLVTDPETEKREALRAFIHCAKNGHDSESGLARRYSRVVHEGVSLFMPLAYASLVEKHGWLSSAVIDSR